MKFALAAIIATCLTFTPAAARQDDPRLDSLFEELLAASDVDAAQAAEQSIWRVWTEAGDTILDDLMAVGIRAMQGLHFDAAMESFDAIIEADPDFAEGWNKRATLYYMMERYGESIRDVERTLALEPRHFGALSGMGLIFTALDDETSALAWFRQALGANPHMPFIRLRVKLLQEKLGGEPI